MSLNTMQKIAVGFLGVILLGAVLLWLPVSNQEPIAFADALFTAVSAVCVTGLVTTRSFIVIFFFIIRKKATIHAITPSPPI